MKTLSVLLISMVRKLKIRTISSPYFLRHRERSTLFSVAFAALLALIIGVFFYTSSSASSTGKQVGPVGDAMKEVRSLARVGLPHTHQRLDNPTLTRILEPVKSSEFWKPLIPQGSLDETISTFAVVAGACTDTPQDKFNLGDSVCAKVANAPLRETAALRRFNWSGTKGFIRQSADVLLDPDSNIFTLPTSNTSTIDGELVDNRGTWTVSINSTGDNTTRAIAYFSVSDPANTAADLAVYNFSTDTTDPIEPGANTGFFVWLSNTGPDAASNVHLTQALPPNMTYVSTSQESGPTFTCTNLAGVTDCSVTSLASGAIATLTINYSISGTAPNGIVTSVVDISSDINDPRPDNNSSKASVEIRTPGAAPATCALGCPGDMVITADATQGGQAGAFVTLGGGIEVSGDCGGVTTSPASGSFFPVGTTPVSVSSTQGGGSCSFTVTVLDTPAPTITCNSDLTATASGTQTEVSVNVVAPSATGNGIAVTGTRNDNRDVSDAYPIGTTIINWTATDADGRTASCTQRIIVTSADAPTISCPMSRTFNATTGCSIVLTAAEIGTPTATGNNVLVTTRRSDDLALTDPFPTGQTTITWTATDDQDRVVSCSQIITVTSAGNDTTPPTLNVPADLSVTTNSCSAVLDDELGVATADDNCTSSVQITRTGVPFGFVFPTGTTTITYIATDAAGNQTIGSQHVTVTENTPPTISAPASLTLSTGPTATACETLVSDGVLGVATANDNCAGVTISRTGVPVGNLFPVGQTVVTYTATDASGNTASATQTVTVIDNTPPVITAPADKTLFTGPGATSCDVTVSDLDATLGTATASDNCAGVTVVRGGTNVFPLGETLVTYTATDAHGNSASAAQRVTVVDNTAPVISCPANITVSLPLNSTATSMVVNYPAPATTTDNCAGSVSVSYSTESGSVFPVGTTTVTATATDAHGNSASCSFTVTVLYDFAGFFSPVANLPTVNEMNAGRAIPVKFSLSGNKGLSIFPAGYPVSQQVICNDGAPVSEVEETTTAGGSSLSYSSVSDQYNYVWATESGWAGTCRQLTIKLNDGSLHKANFRFR